MRCSRMGMIRRSGGTRNPPDLTCAIPPSAGSSGWVNNVPVASARVPHTVVTTLWSTGETGPLIFVFGNKARRVRYFPSSDRDGCGEWGKDAGVEAWGCGWEKGWMRME